MGVEIVILPSFERKLKKLEKTHQERILKITKQIKERGLGSLKILRVKDKYLLTEYKSKRPPYRLYVFVDQDKRLFYIVDWIHKNKQKKAIKKLSSLLEKGLGTGLEQVLSNYFK